MGGVCIQGEEGSASRGRRGLHPGEEGSASRGRRVLYLGGSESRGVGQTTPSDTTGYGQ